MQCKMHWYGYPCLNEAIVDGKCSRCLSSILPTSRADMIIQPKPPGFIESTELIATTGTAAEVIGALKPMPAPVGLDEDQILIWDMYEKARLTALKKNLAYGSSVFTKGALTPELSADAVIRVRMGDKISRLKTLLANPEKNMVSDESVGDTMMDLATYAFLWLIAKQKGI